MPWAAAIGALASAGVGIAGAVGAFAPDSPDAPNYGQMSRDAQQAQIDLLPEKYRARQQYDPKFAALQRDIQYENLFGTTAGSREEEYIDYEPREQRIPTGEKRYNKKLGVVETVYETTTVYDPVVRKRTVQTTGSPGMLALAEQATPRLNRLSIDSQNQQTAANLGRLQQYGPDAFKAIQNFDPASAALSDQLLGNAQEELTAGRGMTASQRRDSEQAVRGAQGARGLGMGPTDAFQEAMYLGDRGEQQLNRRQAYASSILGQRNGLYGRAYEALGLSPGQGADASPYLGAAGQQGPDYTAVNPAAYSVGMAGYGAQQNAAMAGYDSQMGSLGFLGNLGGQAFRNYANQPKTGGSGSNSAVDSYMAKIYGY
jgi:hypothetical protein